RAGQAIATMAWGEAWPCGRGILASPGLSSWRPDGWRVSTHGMRILHVTPFYEPAWAYGGMARSSAGLCRALARRGHEVTVATALLDPLSPLEESRDGVR